VKRTPGSGPSAADVTRTYIDEHLSVREALRDEIVNYTALARRILSEKELTNEEAVTVACRRIERTLVAQTPELARVRELIGRSRLQVHSRVALLRLRDDWEVLDRLLEVGRRTLSDPTGRKVFELFQGTEALTVLCEESYLGTILPEIPERLLISVERNLASLAFRSYPEVAEIPGVLAVIADALYRRGINCLETVSVHTDSILVFRDVDVIPAYQVLSDLLAPGPAAVASADASRSQQTGR
jgi:hypothetical protein